ncbi:histidinol-phosphate transaminase [Alcaligenaceae bacterium]|nr:histidinol-phosphate transaminase [Alcaligenaceae bacterium]
MSRFLSDHVADLTPYTPGEQAVIPNLLKLNTNEHPYGPSPRALAAIQAATTDSLRLYPDYSALALRTAIAKLHGLQADQVFLGNGSDEVLAHVFDGLLQHGKRPLLMPDITYSFYRTYCKMYDIQPELVPLAEDFSIRVADYTVPRGVQPAGIIFANPNAPTGLALSLADIEAIARANPDIPVVVDEAYVDFGAESASALLGRYDNLVVIHTLSKSRALAGLRVGFALASKAIVDGLIRVKDSFNSYPLDSLAQAGALASIQDEDYFQTSCKAVIDARTGLGQELAKMGFNVLPSAANFVFVRHPDHDAATIAADLRKHGILVRHFTVARIEQFLRITVGTPDDCARLCNTLKTVLAK